MSSGIKYTDMISNSKEDDLRLRSPRWSEASWYECRDPPQSNLRQSSYSILQTSLGLIPSSGLFRTSYMQATNLGLGENVYDQYAVVRSQGRHSKEIFCMKVLRPKQKWYALKNIKGIAEV